MLNKFIIIFLFVFIYFFVRYFFKLDINKKFLRVKKFKTFNKRNLNDWMNLTKKERYDLSKKESISYLNKRKVLLTEIREEYKRISKGNSEKT